MLLKALDTLGVGNADGGGGPVGLKEISPAYFCCSHTTQSKRSARLSESLEW